MTANNPEREPADTEYRQATTQGETQTGMDENLAGALCYLFGFITGLIFFVIEDENEFVRFHAAQSIVTFGLVAAASIVLSIISTMLTAILFSSVGSFGLFGIVSLFISLGWMVISLASLGLWLFLMFKAYQGEKFRVPIAANFADNLV